MSTIRCDIVSAEEEIFHGVVSMVVATGEMGELGIAPRHAPLITRLKPGQVRVILENGEEQFFYVSGGTVQLAYEETPYRSIFKPGMWTLDELDIQVPQMMQDIVNPAPPPADLAVAGRGA